MTTSNNNIRQRAMENDQTFLELPLDRDLYKVRAKKPDKPPLRVVLTEAGSKIGLNIMYKICTGEIFGYDQKIILHLINTKGSVVQQRASMLDLEECGFSVVSELVTSADPDKTYGNVDYVISIATFEELPGHPPCNSFLYQLNKCRNAAKNMREFGKPDTKLIICGPSTKGVVILLTCVRHFEPSIPIENISGVTCLDEALAKNLIGSELKLTSDKIKNVVIWGGTFPDIKNATVLTYASDDLGQFEEVEIPVMDALRDQSWIYEKLIPTVLKRILHGNLARHGMAVAMATARHLRIIHNSSDSEKEIVAMAAIIPPEQPYGSLKDTGMSLPVTVRNGVVKVREGVEIHTSSQLLIQRLLYRFQNDISMITVFNLVKYMREYEERVGEQFVWTEHAHLIKKEYYSAQVLTYIISPDLEDQMPAVRSEVRKKSIIWEDANDDTTGTARADLLTRVNFRKKSKITK